MKKQKFMSRRFLNSYVKSNPAEAATVSKLVTNPDSGDKNDKLKYTDIDGEFFNDIDTISNKYEDTVNTLKLFPELRLAAEIYGSIVTSPGDSVDALVTVNNNLKTIPTDIRGKMVMHIQEQLDANYELSSRLDHIMWECQVGKGSFARITLPENSLDALIHGAKSLEAEELSTVISALEESASTPIGFLDTFDVPALEDDNVYFEVPKNDSVSGKPAIHGITVLDNYEVLRLPRLKDKLREVSLESSIYGSFYSSVGLSNDKRSDSNDLRTGHIFGEIKESGDNVLHMPTEAETVRPSLNRPLTFEVPVECVRPIIVPGRPDKPKGFIVVLDDNYNFLTLETNIKEKVKEELESVKSGTKDQRCKASLDKLNIGKESKSEKVEDSAFRRFQSVVENQLSRRLKGGILENNSFELGETSDIDYVMFLRMLQGKKSKLLFIPEQMMAYYSLSQDDKGVGKNVLDDICDVNIMRGALRMSDVNANLTNNIRTTNVEMGFSKNDPNVAKTMKTAASAAMKTRRMSLPNRMPNFNQFGDWVSKRGWTFSFKSHPGLPETSFDFSDKTIERPTNQGGDLDKQLQRQQYNAFGLTEEMIEAGASVEFASRDIANKKLLMKRTRSDRRLLNGILTKEARHICRSDPFIYTELFNYVKQLEKYLDKTDITETPENIINMFIDATIFIIPNHEEEQSTEQANTKYRSYKDGLKDAIEAWVSDNMFDSELFPDTISDKVEEFKQHLTSYFLREYQIKHSYYPELSHITTMGYEGNSYLNMGEVTTKHVEGLYNSLRDLLKGTKKGNAKLSKLIDDIEEYIEDRGGNDDDDEPSDNPTGDDGAPNEEPKDGDEPKDDEKPKDGEEPKDDEKPKDDDEPKDDEKPKDDDGDKEE